MTTTIQGRTLATIDLTNCGETSIHQFTAFASDVGFPIGQWPHRAETTLGNKLPFILDDTGEGWAKYRQTCGCIRLTVFNT